MAVFKKSPKIKRETPKAGAAEAPKPSKREVKAKRKEKLSKTGKIVLVAIGIAAMLLSVSAMACSGVLNEVQSKEDYKLTGGVAATVNGVNIKEDSVTEQIMSMRQSAYESDKDWAAYLSQQGLTPQSYRENVIDSIARQYLLVQAEKDYGIKVTQEDLDKGEPIIQGLRRFMKWCGPDAEFAEWGMDDVPVLKQNLFLCNLDESRPTVWYDLQQLFLREYPRKEGEGMKLENVVTRMGIPLERPFHDALSDTLYTADLCRMLDLRAGLAAYPSEEDTLRQSLCPTPGDYRDFRVFRGYLDQSMWKLDPVIGTMACPVCGTALQPDDVWLKKGSSGWYTLSQCPVCKGRGGEAGRGVFQKYRMSRRDGLHWAFARCVQMPDDASLVRWKKQKAQYLERQRLKAERQAAEAEAARHIF